jgi:signal peptidase II
VSEYDPQDWHDTSVPRPRPPRSWTWLAGIAGAIIVADQITKIAVRAAIEPGDTIDVLPGVDLVRARNKGIAFGLLPGNQGIVVGLTFVALAIIALVLARLAYTSRTVAIGGGLLLGGSLGNLLDRLARGGVTDFIDVPLWPAFNVADVAIVAGAAVIALGLLQREPDEE